MLPFPFPPSPGLTYGEALARELKSLFSPILRVEEDG